MPTKKESTSIVPITQYQALVKSPKDLLAIFQENLQGEHFTERDLSRVTVPPGGSTIWTVPGLDGDDSKKEILGILVHVTTPRVYWASNIMDGAPPDCFSPDGEVGVGNPGGACDSCPLNEWGSADARNDGSPARGKACKEKRMIFVLRPESLLPLVIQAPTTSLRNIRNYQLRLAEAGLARWQVITAFKLERENRYDYPTAIIVPSVATRIPEEHWPKIREMVDAIQRLFGRVLVQPTADTDNV